MAKLNPIIQAVASQFDAPDGQPGANATWTKFTSATEATQATALTDAGYIDIMVANASGVPTAVRIPCFLTT
jgi:hypothetical protein